MNKITSYKDLIAWQKAIRLAKEIYKVSEKFPSTEKYGMTTQIRRAVVSIPCNIAEGYGRRTKADFIHFIDIAQGSANEVETLLSLAVELAAIEKEQISEIGNQIIEIQKILRGLAISLENNDKKRISFANNQ